MRLFKVNAGGAVYHVVMPEWDHPTFDRLTREMESETRELESPPVEVDEATQRATMISEEGACADDDGNDIPGEQSPLYDYVQEHTEPTIIWCDQW